MGCTDVAGIVEHVEQVAAARAAGRGGGGDGDGVDRAVVEEALRSVGKLQAWLSSSRTELVTVLAEHDPFPEKTAAECTRGSTRDAIKDRDRSETIDRVPDFGSLLDDGAITEGHIDALTNTARGLDGDEQRAELFDRVGSLGDVASVASVEEWRRRLGMEAKHIRRDDGIDRVGSLGDVATPPDPTATGRRHTWSSWRFDGVRGVGAPRSRPRFPSRTAGGRRPPGTGGSGGMHARYPGTPFYE